MQWCIFAVLSVISQYLGEVFADTFPMRLLPLLVAAVVVAMSMSMSMMVSMAMSMPVSVSVSMSMSMSMAMTLALALAMALFVSRGVVVSWLGGQVGA